MKEKLDVVDKRHLRTIKTKQKLLMAAREVFLEEGFQKATISQMIKKAGIGYGTAYVHFEGKEQILMVLIDDSMEKFYRIAEISFSPNTKEEAWQIILSQATAFLKMAETERSMMQLFEQAIGMSPSIATKWKAIREKFIQSISKDIAFAQQNGLARAELNCTLVAKSWFFTNEMYLWEIVRNEHQGTVEEIAKTITAVYTEGLYH